MRRLWTCFVAALAGRMVGMVAAQEECAGLIGEARVPESVLDSESVTLHVVLENEGAEYEYAVDWGDDSPLDRGNGTERELTLAHDYRFISTFRITLEVRRSAAEEGEEPDRCDTLLVAVNDDDSHPPAVAWDLPDSPDDPPVVGWHVTDPSGLAFVSVVVQGPEGPIAFFDSAEGRIDLSEHGLGVYRVEIQSRDLDLDRPDDDLGMLDSATVVVRSKPPEFRRGDANLEGAVDLSDAVYVLFALFRGEVELPCADAADANDDGAIDISDPIWILEWLFVDHSRPPPDPGPFFPGRDPTGDDLTCREGGGA